MLIECQTCQKKLNISEEKIPFGRPFTFVCPNCKSKNTMTLPERRVMEISLEDPPEGAAAAGGAPASSAAPPPPPPAPPTRATMSAPRSTMRGQGGASSPFNVPGMPPPDFGLPPDFDSDLPEGMKAAMIAFDSEETQEKLTDKLTSMGYRVSAALNIRDAVKQLKFGRFQLIIIQEDYYGASLTTNQIIRAVNSLELATRHDMFVVVVGKGFTSLDDLTAFSLSLDTVINNNDLEDIERILISAIGHSNKFFSVYRELRVTRGLDYR
ncbi:MAG: hypothetical protein LBE31_03280 [Deltaproteobacteria bacterium]|jgi:hypothetical protein|nr:hypothetical protein [Deltaproteobacteria bacterium]